MKKPKWIAWLLALMLCFGLFPSAALAEETAAEPVEVRTESGAFDFVEGEALDTLQEAAAHFPSAYDLRHVPTEDGGEVSYVTPVRLQNPYGTCWGFAAIAAAESSLLSSGLAAAYGFDADTLDLSEKHLAFFATSYLDEPEDPQHGEGTHFREIPEGEESSYAYRYNTGGFVSYATSLFASGIGPVLEKIIDPETGEEVYFDEIVYRGERGEAAYRESAMEYDDAGQPVEASYRLEPAWYSEDDNWYLPNEDRFFQSFQLRDSIILPSPAGVNEEGEYEFHPEAVNAIKQQISQYHRAVAIGFCAESFLPGQDASDKEYMSEHWAHYTNVSEYANHMVTIVGYDDNYPRENFNSSTENGGSAQPEGDGAFLVKNSWGSELNEFPNNGRRHWGLLDGKDTVPYDPDAKAKEGNRATGYFWISYYDRSLYEPETFVFDDVTDEIGYYVEQMDFMNGRVAALTGNEPGAEYMTANVFKAEATSSLRAISVMTSIPGTKVSYAVYLLGEGFDDPTDGVLIEEGERTFEYGGYHKIDLASPRVLTKGQRYSVRIKESAEDFSCICIPMVYNNLDDDCYCVGVINPGESYLFSGGAWEDLGETGMREALTASFGDLSEYGIEVVIDNFQIKSYLYPITYPDGGENPVFDGYLTVSNWQEGDPGLFQLAVGESKTLTAEFRGLGAGMPDSWNPSFEWVSTEEGVLSVSTGTPKKGNAVLTGLEPGETKLIVYAGDAAADPASQYPDNYGIRVLTILVTPEGEDWGAEEDYPGTEFDDVPETYWGWEAIMFAVEEGLMRGVSDRSFAPEDTLSRAMAATVLYRMAGQPEVSTDVGFDDVAAGKWYSDAIAWAFAEGIAEGHGSTFGVNEPITREQLVLMLWRFCGKPEAGKEETGAGAWAAEAMSWAVEEGLLQGDEEGYRPGDAVSRAEAAALFMRFLLLEY